VTDSLPITPDTKVAQLLEAYPELVPARDADRAAGRPRFRAAAVRSGNAFATFIGLRSGG